MFPVKAIYHKNIEHSSKANLRQISEGSSKEKTQALVTIHDDEGFNWNKYIKEGKRALVAEVKTKRKEEIRQGKTYIERCFADYKIEEMQKEYEEVRSYGRWDKKRECYINCKGDPVVDSSKFYSTKAVDKDYLKKLDKIIRGVMTTSLKKRDEERLHKSVEKMVDELKETTGKDDGEGEQKDEEGKKEEVAGDENQEKADEKLEKPTEEAVNEKQHVSSEDQEEKAKEAEVPNTEVIIKTESSKVINKTVEQCKKCMETCSACTKKDEKFRTRDI
ncbi:hypothetical protein Hanom_Chr12g01136761 [Helianthus anomalus]